MSHNPLHGQDIEQARQEAELLALQGKELQRALESSTTGELDDSFFRDWLWQVVRASAAETSNYFLASFVLGVVSR
jgi:hypothetical protein